MDNFKYVVHGSENSLDRDIFVFIDNPLENQKAKELCEKFNGSNANLLVVKNGVVDWCYKGTKDECNNSLLSTYDLHRQEFDCPIEKTVDRVYALKMLRTIRGLLSYVSRTEHRLVVKAALRSQSLEEKINVLKLVNFSNIDDFKKTNKIETYKFFAFQMGQTRALLEDGLELFTKNRVAERYPELTPYLQRIDCSVNGLQKFYNEFVDFIAASYRKVENKDFYYTEFNGKREVFDVKGEVVLPPVVVFDIDGTLMDESHRAHLRESKKWEDYFKACVDDVPIKEIVELTKRYKDDGYEVWVISGRSVICHDETVNSLRKHGVFYDNLKLRGKDNFIPDYVIKVAWVKKLIGLQRVEVVYDDSPKVIESFRKAGLNVVDVKSMNQVVFKGCSI